MAALLRHDLFRLVHYWWPLVVGWSVTEVVARATARPADPSGVAVLLCGIGAAYSLDRRLDRPAALTPWVRQSLSVAALGSATVGAGLLLWLPLETAALVPVLGVVALGYRALKRVPLAKNLCVPLVWTWATMALPFHDGSWFGWRWVLQPVAAPLFLLCAAGCLLCDLKDEPDDRHAGDSSLAVTFGGRGAAAIGVCLALAGGLLAFVEQRSGLTVSAVGLGLTALRPQLLATDIVGPLLVDVILSMPGFLIAWQIV